MDRQQTLRKLCGVQRALLGVIHVRALPGTPKSRSELAEIRRVAVEEASLYRRAGFHGLVLENMHDRPYLKGGVGPEIVAAMTAVGVAVREAVELPLGIQVLAGANREALAVALACGGSFIRTEGFVFAHVADEGWIDAGAGELLRYRRAIGAESIRVFADVKKKHSSHAVTGDVGLVETARAAEFFLADGVVVTGAETGTATDAAEVAAVAEAVGVPVLVGSGVDADNVSRYAAADALIVGSSVKADGHWAGRLDPARAAALAEAFGV